MLSCVLTSHNKRILYCIVPGIWSLLSLSSADGGVRSLANVKPQLNGETGNKGRSKHCHGSNAENTVVHASASNYYYYNYYHEIVYKVFLLLFAFNSLSNTPRCTCSPFVSRSSSPFPFHSLTVICYLVIFFYYVYAKHFVICLLKGTLTLKNISFKMNIYVK